MADWYGVSTSTSDTKTGSPVSSSLFIKGTPLNSYNERAATEGAPPAGGGTQFYVPAGTVTPVTFVAPGYQTQTYSLSSEGAPGPYQLDAALNPTGQAPGSLVVASANAGLSGYTVQVSGNGIDPQTQTQAGDDPSLVFRNLAPGQYTVSTSLDGYATGTDQTAVFPGQATPVAPLLTPLQSPGGPQETALAPPANPDSAAGSALLTPSDPDPESIYSNSWESGYWTSAQCRVYIGNLFLDELQSIQFALQSNILPQYAYSSFDADAFATGRRLVQGQILINYVHDRYLYEAILNHQLVMSVQMLNPDATAQNAQQLLKALNQSGSSAADQQIAKLVSSLKVVQQAKALRSQAAAGRWTNPVYLRAPFDLRIEIGDGELKTTRFLEKCRLMSDEQIFDQSGNLIGEAYGFVARRLR